MEQRNSNQIIVVDDMPGISTLIKEILSEENYSNISAFTNPKEALECVFSSNEEPAFVLTDYNMPEMSGLELLNSVRSKYPSINGAILTANPKAIEDQSFPIIDKGGKFVSVVLQIIKAAV